MKVRDPVCGMQFEEEEAAAKTEHRGKTYSFCSDHCKAAFDKDPERYVEETE